MIALRRWQVITISILSLALLPLVYTFGGSLWGWISKITGFPNGPRRQRRLDDLLQPQQYLQDDEGSKLILHHSRNPLPITSVHCIGSNFDNGDHNGKDKKNRSSSTDWEYRSCVWNNLCWDTENSEFVALASEAHTKLSKFYQASSTMSFTVTLSTLLLAEQNAVSLGAILDPIDTTTASETTSTKWFPTVLDPQQAQQRYIHGYYQLSEDQDATVWIPWQPPDSDRNFVWTCWWPLFVLASLFPSSATATATTAATATKSVISLRPWLVFSNIDGSGKGGVLSKRQQTVVQEWRQFVGPVMSYGHVGHATNNDKNKGRTNDSEPALICLRRVMAGVGHLVPSLKETDSIGHGPMLRAFAQHVEETLLTTATATAATTTMQSETARMTLKDESSKVYWIELSKQNATEQTKQPPEYDALRKTVQARFSSFQHVSIKSMSDVRQYAFKLSSLMLSALPGFPPTFVMTLSTTCWEPLLLLLPLGMLGGYTSTTATAAQAMNGRPRLLVLYRPSDLLEFDDCVYVLNNAATLRANWIDVTMPHTEVVALMEQTFLA